MNDKSRRIVLGIVLVIVAVSIFYLESTKVNSNSSQKSVDVVPSNASLNSARYQEKAKKYDKAPELEGIRGYINSNDNLTISSLISQGKTVLVDFWTYSCINCIRTLPYIDSWDKKYKDKGLVIIGVHTPEFDFEKEYNNVLAAVKKYGIEHPVVLDNDYVTWNAFNNRFWPRRYLIDSDGFIRYDHIGEGSYEETEKEIQSLLEEAGKNVVGVDLTKENSSGGRLETTPEIYVGYDFALGRGQNIGNQGGLVINSTSDYTLLGNYERDIVYIGGKWKSNSDNLELVGETGEVILKFSGKQANIVGNSINPTKVISLIDDKNFASIVVDHPDLYTVYNGEYGTYVLKLDVKKGFILNSFTFG